jgi:ACS family tartrate transporter-like MFS transporter
MTGAVGRQAIAKVSRRLLPLIALLYFVNILDRINLGFAALTMNKDLGLSAYVYGLGAGIFFFGYFIFEVPSNLILERIGARLWIARIMLTWGFISAGMAFVTGETSFIVMRFLLGVAEAGFFPGMILYLTYWYPASYRARVIAGFMLAIPVSIAIGAPLSTTILGLDGLLGFKGWQWLFIIEGAPAVVLSATVLYFMTDRPAHAKWLTAAERDWLEGALRDEREAINAAHGTYNPFRALIDPHVLSLSFICLCFITAGSGMVFFLPQIIKGLGFSNFQTGFVTSVPSIAGSVGMVVWGWYSDRIRERRWNLAVASLCGAVGLAGAGLFNASYCGLLAMCIASIGLNGIKPCFWPLPSTLMTGTAAAASIAAISSVGNLGGFVGPYVVGWIKDTTRSFEAGFYFLSVCAVLAAIVTMLAMRSSSQRAASKASVIRHKSASS